MSDASYGYEGMIQATYPCSKDVELSLKFTTKSKQKDFKLEANKLIEYLGGKDNIVNYETNKSRFIVELKDTKKVNKEGIQKIGAQGIVEIDNQLKIILGEQAQKIKKFIDDLK